jgi:hypothetical protein
MNIQTSRRLRLLLGAAALLAAALLLAAPGPARAAAPNIDHTDGYISVSPDGRCMVLKQHDGRLLALVGRRRGLGNNDHVRLEGHFNGDRSCGAQGGFEVTDVQTIWADDNHKTTYYDHLKDGPFPHWVDVNRAPR